MVFTSYHAADCPYCCGGHNTMSEILLKPDIIAVLQDDISWYEELIVLMCVECKAKAMWMEGMQKMVRIDPFFCTEEEQEELEEQKKIDEKLCVNCKWCSIEESYERANGFFNKCLHPNNTEPMSQEDIEEDEATHLVGGDIAKVRERKYRWPYCSHHRGKKADVTHCGISASWFEDKDAIVTAIPDLPAKMITKPTGFWYKMLHFGRNRVSML